MRLSKIAKLYIFKYAVDFDWDPDEGLFEDYQLDSGDDVFQRFEETEAPNLDSKSLLEVFLELSLQDKLPEAVYSYVTRRINEASPDEIDELNDAFEIEDILQQGPLNDFAYTLRRQ